MRVMLIHGFLANRTVLWPLAKRLSKLGHQTEVFGYASRKGDLQWHADQLVAALGADDGPVAVIAHSLGGLLVHRALSSAPELPVSHRVFIATPHHGCRAVRVTSKTPLARLMGRSIRSATRGEPVPPHPARTGVIIGTRDRTVRPAEADLPHAADRLRLPYMHNELVWRPRTANAVHRFLTTGAFEPGLDRNALGI